MPDPTEPQDSTPSTQDVLSIGDFAEMMMSGVAPLDLGLGSDVPKAGSDSAAGDPPAEHAPDALATPLGSEAAASDVLAGVPPVDAAVPAVDAGAPPDDDLLKDSAPFSYAADGESKSIPEIIKLSDGSGIIDPAYMPMLAHRLGERDHLFKTAGEQREQIQRYDRITQWDQADGKGGTTRLTGIAAIQAQQAEHADAKAELAVLREVMRDPAQLRALIDGVDEATGALILNKQALANLDTRVENISLKTRRALHEYYATVTQPSAPAAGGAPDYVAAAPNIVNAVAAQLGITGLHADDAKQLAGMAPFSLRPATAQDVRANPTLKLGEDVVREEFYTHMQYLNGLRSETSKAVTTAKAASSAAVEVAQRNKVREAAAAAGIRPTPVAATPARPANPAADAVRTKRQQQDDAYARQLQVSRAAMG